MTLPPSLLDANNRRLAGDWGRTVPRGCRPHLSSCSRATAATCSPNGQSWDAFLHVHPRLESGRRALAMVFNPTSEPITIATLRLNLYYAGLTDTAMVRIGDGGSPVVMALARDYSLVLQRVYLPAKSSTWVLVEAPARAAESGFL